MASTIQRQGGSKILSGSVTIPAGSVSRVTVTFPSPVKSDSYQVFCQINRGTQSGGYIIGAVAFPFGKTVNGFSIILAGTESFSQNAYIVDWIAVVD